jgi:hypothetical protein
MTQYMFGTGQVFTMPVGGGSPLRLGALQDVSVEFSADVKQLFGQYSFPLAVARGKTKIEGKIGTANIDAKAWNDVFFGAALTNNAEKLQANNEAGAIPNASTYVITVANAADFYLDLGVMAVLTGLPFKQVASAPAAGQYMVANGVYTFAAADAGKAVLLNYLYDGDTAGSGSLLLTNTLMGATPKFQMVASQTFEGKTFTLILFSCVSDKLSMPLKQDDFMMPELSFQAQANASNQIGLITTSSAVGGGA